MVELTDEYFLNLTMDYDHRDDEIYPKWAVWCAKSDDKYYIDGKDHHFYTHVRTDEEIKVERKRRELMDFSMEQRHSVEDSKEEVSQEDFREYERYIFENMHNENILSFEPKTFAEWVKTKE